MRFLTANGFSSFATAKIRKLFGLRKKKVLQRLALSLKNPVDTMISLILPDLKFSLQTLHSAL